MEKSYQTKMELASAFKEILKQEDFRKMNVKHITDKAGMSRKSFYYHFQDKYDLVNWIFDTEFADIMDNQTVGGRVCLERLCHYLYSEAQYYRKLLHITGQNSLSEHIGKYIRKHVLLELNGDSMAEMKSVLLADSMLVMLKRWLYDMNTISSAAFVQLIYEILANGKQKAALSAGAGETMSKYVRCVAG